MRPSARYGTKKETRERLAQQQTRAVRQLATYSRQRVNARRCGTARLSRTIARFGQHHATEQIRILTQVILRDLLLEPLSERRDFGHFLRAGWVNKIVIAAAIQHGVERTDQTP